jgi:hypothetical protein
LSSLLQHYHAPVQTAAELIKTPAFRKHPQPVAKMAQGSYNSAIQVQFMWFGGFVMEFAYVV